MGTQGISIRDMYATTQDTRITSFSRVKEQGRSRLQTVLNMRPDMGGWNCHRVQVGAKGVSALDREVDENTNAPIPGLGFSSSRGVLPGSPPA